jgi:hypothetical protein
MFAMTDQLLNRFCLIAGGSSSSAKAQNLDRDCFEYLRHLHDDPATHFALLFDGWLHVPVRRGCQRGCLPAPC